MRTRPSPASVLVLLVALVMLTLRDCRTAGSLPTSSLQETLDQQQVVDRPAADATYRRAAFGRAWADVDSDGCNTRDQVPFSTLDQHRHCDYATRYIAAKARYRLPVDRSEKKALHRLLRACPS